MCRLNDRISTRAQVDSKNRNHIYFEYMIAFLEPDYTVPCRQTMTVQLEKMYSKAAGLLREILSLGEKVAITTDAWSVLTTESHSDRGCSPLY